MAKSKLSYNTIIILIFFLPYCIFLINSKAVFANNIYTFSLDKKLTTDIDSCRIFKIKPSDIYLDIDVQQYIDGVTSISIDEKSINRFVIQKFSIDDPLSGGIIRINIDKIPNKIIIFGEGLLECVWKRTDDSLSEYKLTDKEYKKFIRISPIFKEVDTDLGKAWKIVNSIVPNDYRKQLIYEQREWVKNERDKEANEYIKRGLSRIDAYIETTKKRIVYLINIAKKYQATKDTDKISEKERNVNKNTRTARFYLLHHEKFEKFARESVDNCFNNGILEFRSEVKDRINIATQCKKVDCIDELISSYLYSLQYYSFMQAYIKLKKIKNLTILPLEFEELKESTSLFNIAGASLNLINSDEIDTIIKEGTLYLNNAMKVNEKAALFLNRLKEIDM